MYHSDIIALLDDMKSKIEMLQLQIQGAPNTEPEDQPQLTIQQSMDQFIEINNIEGILLTANAADNFCSNSVSTL